MTSTKEIKPKSGIDASLTVPGSKSHTQRALAMAALAEGNSVLTGALIAEDTLLMVDALRSLGTKIVVTPETITVYGTGARLKAPAGDIYLGNNGTAIRFLTAIASLVGEKVTLTGMPRLTERPLRPLINALRQQGVTIHCPVREGFPPLAVEGFGLAGGQAVFHDPESSQYISALMIVAPCARRGVEIVLRGQTVSRPYLSLTRAVMKDFGVTAQETERGYHIASGQNYRGTNCRIEGDASSASYFFLAAALTGGRVEITNLPATSCQGDLRFLEILSTLGCRVESKNEGATVYGGELARGDYDFDMGDIPDLVPTLAVLAAFRQGVTRIGNCAHLRHKESDRLAVLAAELGKMGIAVRENPAGLEITGGTPSGAAIEAHEDHRIAMAFAIAGLVLPGMTIAGSQWVNKSFPRFWEELDKL